MYNCILNVTLLYSNLYYIAILSLYHSNIPINHYSSLDTPSYVNARSFKETPSLFAQVCVNRDYRILSPLLLFTRHTRRWLFLEFGLQDLTVNIQLVSNYRKHMIIALSTSETLQHITVKDLLHTLRLIPRKHLLKVFKNN